MVFFRYIQKASAETGISRRHGHQEDTLMTVKTLVKAKTIYKSGGVERTGPTRYAVTSTSGETYHVHTAPARCSCPARVTCSHQAAVDISIAKRHRSKRHAVAAAA